jgi:hypothetical protein
MFRRALLVSSLALTACSSHAPGSELTGRASMAIASVPTNVSCIQVTSANSIRSVSNSFSVTAGQSTVLELSNLPTGTVTFTGAAFPAPCAQVTSSSIPDWVGAAVTASIDSTSVTPVTLDLTPNGQTAVTVNFNGDDAGADAGPCNSVTCTAIDNCHIAGTCDPTTGACTNPLAPGANCAGGQACVAWYPDCDEDSFGDSTATPIFSCSPSGLPTPACTAPLVGSYTANHTDCCDIDSNAHPGQAAFFTTPDACGSTTQASTPFDYNCDGVDEQQSNGPTDCNTFTCTPDSVDGICQISGLPADCNGSTNNFDQAACGQTWDVSFAGCAYVGPPAGPLCVATGNGGTGGTQACQ